MFDRINLVPQKPLSSKIKGKIPPILLAILAVIATNLYVQDRSLSGAIAKVEKEIQVLQTSAENYSETLAQFQARKTEQTRLSEQNTAVAARVRRLEGLILQKKLFSQLMAFLARTTPQSIIFRSIRFKGNDGELLGEAKGYEDLPDFVELLRNSGLFTKTTLTGINRKDRSGETFFEFHITGRLSESNPRFQVH